MKQIAAAIPIILAVVGFIMRRFRKSGSNSSIDIDIGSGSRHDSRTRRGRSGRTSRSRRRSDGPEESVLEKLQDLGVTDALKDVAKNPKGAMKSLGIGDEMSERVKKELDEFARDDDSFDLESFLGRARDTFGVYFDTLKGKQDQKARQLMSDSAYQELQRHRQRSRELGDRSDEIVATRIGSALVTSVSRSDAWDEIVVEFNAVIPRYEKARGRRKAQVENPFVQELWTFRREHDRDWLLVERRSTEELDDRR
jgi:predicted lipid-binding transport protein (Tim44 family)